MNGNLHLKSYQSRIVQQVGSENALLVLPNGSETLIFAETIRQFFENKCKKGRGQKVLLLVPTHTLVSKQAQILRKYMCHQNDIHGNTPSISVVEHQAGTLPSEFDVLVSVSSAFLVQLKALQFTWDLFGLVLYDKANMILEDHPHRRINLDILKAPKADAPQVIGIMGSFTQTFSNEKFSFFIEKLCCELGAMHLRIPSEENIDSDDDEIEVLLAEHSLPVESKQGCVPKHERKPHLLNKIFLDRVSTGKATENVNIIFSCLKQIEADVLCHDPSFKSPIGSASLKSWGLYAHKQWKTAKTTELRHLYMQLEHWYEALKILAISWEESDDLAVWYLKMMQRSLSGSNASQECLIPCIDHEILHSFDFSRLNILAEQLLSQFQVQGGNFRGIILTQQKIACHVLVDFIQQHEELNSVFSPVYMYATKSRSRATASLSLGVAEAHDAAEKFIAGESNLLVTTCSLAQEGTPLPSANCVFHFDPMSDLNLLEVIDKQDKSLLDFLAERDSLVGDLRTGRIQVDELKAKRSQQWKEKLAKRVLGKSIPPLSRLNEFSSRTEVPIMESYEQEPSGVYHCNLLYASPQSETLYYIASHGEACSKKAAKVKAAQKLLDDFEYILSYENVSDLVVQPF